MFLAIDIYGEDYKDFATLEEAEEWLEDMAREMEKDETPSHALILDTKTEKLHRYKMLPPIPQLIKTERF